MEQMDINIKPSALVIGGANGIGLAIAITLYRQGKVVCIADKDAPSAEAEGITFLRVNLLDNDFSFLNDFREIDTLIFTAGFGRVAGFETILAPEIDNSFRVNAVALTKVLRFFFPRMLEERRFYCTVMGSISGLISSPLIALYGATKAAVCSITESLNAELEAAGSPNRILNVSPGSIKGTRFNGGDNNLNETMPLAAQIVESMQGGQTLYIPDYDKTYKGVLERYHADPCQFGLDAVRYKKESGRINPRPQIKIGYLSGTFDLFHIGHLNILRRAKQMCDYLVVGVHRDASHKGKTAFIPFEERCEIVQSIKFVDRVIPSEREDCDVWLKNIVKYDYLFVGSDYKGTERFNRYEEIFSDKDVKIIYLPYTKGTSSTQLRDALTHHLKV